MTQTDRHESIRRRGARPLMGEFRARTVRTSTPVKASLELTKRCDLRCVHCYVGEPLTSEIPIGRFVELIDELSAEGCLAVTLTGGEVGLRDGWLEVAAQAKRRRLLLSVLTSGTAFSESDLVELIRLRPARVAVSLYGSTADRHDAVTCVRGSFDKSIATLQRLRSAGVTCRVASVLMPQNIDDFRGIAAVAKDLGCDFTFDPTVGPRADGTDDVVAHRLDSRRLSEFYLSEIVRDLSKEGRIIASPRTPEAHAAANCLAGLTTLFVDAQGDIYPCMGFPPALGNIVEDSFGDIWWSAEASRHREVMRSQLPECASCDVLAFCTVRCPRLALVEDGDVLGPSARACEMAHLTVEMREEYQRLVVCEQTTS